jgi:hypothetical protein
LLRDAADGAARHDRRLAPVADELRVGVVLGGLGPAREEGAKRDVVHAGLSGGDGAVVPILGDRFQDASGAADRVVVDVLQAQLQAGDVAAFELRREPVRVERRPRDQLEPGRRPHLVL